MKPPKAVKLGGQDWRIKHRSLDPDTNLYGRTIARAALIELDTNQAGAQLRDTLLHEVIHACASNVAVFGDSDDEERVIRHLTPWLLMALRDNPDLVAFLLEP